MAVKTSQLLLGIEQVEARLDRLGDAADDLRDVWPEIGRLFASRQDTVFSSNGLGRWAPVAAVTMRSHQSPLVDTGVMRGGLDESRPIWSREKGAAWGAEKGDRRVFNIAVFHANGTSRMPKRLPVPPLRAAERKAWIGLVGKHLRKAIQ